MTNNEISDALRREARSLMDRVPNSPDWAGSDAWTQVVDTHGFPEKAALLELAAARLRTA